MMRKQLIVLTVLLGSVAGCNVNPAPPSEEDAKAIWEHSNKQLGLEKVVRLVDLKKTDGQFAKVNGIAVYTLFFDARRQYLTSVGHWKPGDVETIHSNYGFQKTENGWQGPDGTHFDH